MSTSLETLEMTAQDRAACHDLVGERAYHKWLNAGCPPGREFDFWLQAEREWIAHDYVPRRPLDGTRPEEVCIGPKLEPKSAK